MAPELGGALHGDASMVFVVFNRSVAEDQLPLPCRSTDNLAQVRGKGEGGGEALVGEGR